MHCKNCLAPLSSEDTYCKVCGTPVERNSNYPSNEEIIMAYNDTLNDIEHSNEIVKNKENITHPSAESIDIKNPVAQEKNITNTLGMEGSFIASSKVANTLDEIPVKKEIPKEIPSLKEEIQVKDVEIKKEGISKKVFILGIVIAIIAASLITTLVCIPLLTKNNNSSKSQESDIITKTVTENRVLFSGYSFLIPEGYTYKISGTQLVVEKTATKESMALQVGTETYANMKSNLTALKTSLTTAKWTVGKLYVDQSVKERNYLTVEATVNNQNVMIAYTQANDKQVFGIVYLNPSSTAYPTNAVETFNDIIDSAEEISNTITTNITNFTTNKIMFTITPAATTTDTTTTTNTTSTTTNTTTKN